MFINIGKDQIINVRFISHVEFGHKEGSNNDEDIFIIVMYGGDKFPITRKLYRELKIKMIEDGRFPVWRIKK